MTIAEVPLLPIRAGRHLATWIVWHTVQVSLVEDGVAPVPTTRTKRRKRK